MTDTLAAVSTRIHIDHEPYETPNPTSGRALYALADVEAPRELFREVQGDAEDELVSRHADVVHVRSDDHFYSQQVTTIVVNTEAKEVAKRRLSFDDLVRLAGDLPPPGPNMMITIDYSSGPHRNPKGALRNGESVWIKNGMEFDVSATDRS